MHINHDVKFGELYVDVIIIISQRSSSPPMHVLNIPNTPICVLYNTVEISLMNTNPLDAYWIEFEFEDIRFAWTNNVSHARNSLGVYEFISDKLTKPSSACHCSHWVWATMGGLP